MSTVAACVCSIPPRADMLARALHTVTTQARTVDAIHVAIDRDRGGAARTRNRALNAADTDYVAFLDDDDAWLPHHIGTLLDTAERTGADLVYGWYTVVGGIDPLAVTVDGRLRTPLGVPFGPEQRDYLLTAGNFIPITCLVRREALTAVGGFPEPMSERWPHPDNEDWGAWQALLRNGATFVHAPETTWVWNHGVGNTSGRPDRW